MKLSNLVGPLLCLLVLSRVVCAQSVSVSGDIRGTISDPSGAVLPKVTATVVDTQTGLQRTVVTDSDVFSNPESRNLESSALTS